MELILLRAVGPGDPAPGWSSPAGCLGSFSESMGKKPWEQSPHC